jgi:hypothetical protein
MKPEDLTAQALGANGTIALYCLNRDLVIQTVNLELDRVGMGPSLNAVFKHVWTPLGSSHQRPNPINRGLTRRTGGPSATTKSLTSVGKLGGPTVHNICSGPVRTVFRRQVQPLPQYCDPK